METDEHTRVDPTRNPPLAGRDRELGRLGEALERALSGHGGLVLVSGEAGIGKTALVKALIAKARETDALVLSGGAYDLTSTPPYGPWLELLDRYPQSPDLPSLPDVMKPGTDPADVRSQQALFTMLRDFLSSVAGIRPLLLVLEDLHWADQASLDLLRFLARQIAKHRILLVATYRDDEVSRQHPLFQLLPLIVRESDTERVELRPLGEKAVRAIVDSRWELVNVDQIRLVKYLLTKAEGNPLFTLEIARSLEQHGHLKETDGNWRLGDLTQVPVPTLVQQVIETRVARLGEDARFPLEVAAVIGQHVPLDVWQVVAHLSDDQLIDVLSQATSWHLLEPTPDRDQMQFVHALTREALYESILLPRRRALHRQVAETLEKETSPIPDTVAYHFQQAEDERAVEWLIRAGDTARETFANLAAAERFAAALALMEKSDTSLEDRGYLLVKLGVWTRDVAPRASIEYLRQSHSIGLQLNDHALQAMSIVNIGQNRFFMAESCLDDLERGTALMRRLSQSDRERIIKHSPGFYVFKLDATLALMFALHGRFDEAISLASRYLDSDDARSHIKRLANERAHGEAALACAHAALGSPNESEQSFRKSDASYRDAGNDWVRALGRTMHFHNTVSTYFLDDQRRREDSIAEVDHAWEIASGVSTSLPPKFGLLPSMYLRGQWDEAMRLALPFANRDMVFHYIALNAVCAIARNQGDNDLAWQQVRTGFPEGANTSPESMWHFFTPELMRLAANLALDSKDPQLARDWLEANDRWMKWGGGRVIGRADGLLIWSRLHQLEGNNELARGTAEEALQVASEPRQPLALVVAHRSLGEFDTLERDYSSAARHLQESIRLADQCAVPFERVLTLLAMAELDAARGNHSDAIRYLTEVRRICTDLGARPMLEKAEQLMARLRPAKGDPRFGLSARELEVLQLVVQGKSDRQIADELFISHRTVMQHVSSILRKLDVDSRSGAAAKAVRDNIV